MHISATEQKTVHYGVAEKKKKRKKEIKIGELKFAS